MNRSLGGTERQWWLQAQRAACNIVLAAHIEAPVDAGKLAAGLAFVQARYALLRSRVTVVGEDVRFTPTDLPLPLRVVPRSAADEWRALAATELVTPFPMDTGPFARVVLVQGPESCELLFVVAHMIMDGLSMVRVLSDILETTETPGRIATPVPHRGTFEDRPPPRARGLAGTLAALRYSAQQVMRAPRDEARARRLRESYGPRRAQESLGFVLDEALTARLRSVSRGKGSSVQGAISTALLFAIHEETKTARSSTFGLHSPINLRKLFVPPVDEEIGNFASGATSWVDVGKGDFWRTARIVKEDIDTAVARGTPFALARLISRSRRMQVRTRPSRLALRIFPDVGVTNLGEARLPETPLAARVTEMHVLPSLPALELLVLALVTVQGRLFCDFHYTLPQLPHEGAQRIATGTLQRIRQETAG